MSKSHTFIYHLVQARLWEPVVAAGGIYYPPTYQTDGFIHATANTEKLLAVANHFYRDLPGDWYCLRMTEGGLERTGVTTVFEATAPVGDKPADFDGAGDELFPHIYGGICPAAVLQAHPVSRAADGAFLAVDGVTD